MDPGSILISGMALILMVSQVAGYWSSHHHILNPQQGEKSWESGTCQLKQPLKRAFLLSSPKYVLGKVVFIWAHWHLCLYRGSVNKANEEKAFWVSAQATDDAMRWPYNSITWVSINVGSKPGSHIVLIPYSVRSHSTHPSQSWVEFLKLRLAPGARLPSRSGSMYYSIS